MTLFATRYSGLLFLLFFSAFYTVGRAQCINRFPYKEDFQNSNGGWKPGGTASDWAWGIPQKTVIYTAGNTNKCWVAGGLTGNFYNENEKSWLQSPCFDFTTLQNPYISILLNWDTENGYDGAAFQYSVDNGITWESAGAFGDAITGCTDNHWFNSSSIAYGVQAQGWSGSRGNGGSPGWVTAYHSFPKLAGKAGVIFRFTFGAGKIKNDFNGFAADDFYIGETITNQLAFTYTCLDLPRKVSFTTGNSDCFIPSSFKWDFNDLASGVANTLSGTDVQHQFSSPGLYNVKLTATNSQNATVSSVQTIIIPDVSVAIATPILCNGNMGSLQASVTNRTAIASYSWSTSPATATPITQAKAGTYEVTATVDGGCSNTVSITLPEPSPLTHVLQTTPADCNNLNGTISVVESGGILPYQYNWQGVQESTSSADNLPSGNYSIVITDKNLCADKIDIVLPLTPSTLTQSITTTIPECGINNGSIIVTTNGGAEGYTYNWMPDISTENVAQNIPSGNYTVVTTDTKQCRDTAFIILPSHPFTVSLGNDTVVCKGQVLLLKPAGNYSSYLWNDGSVTSVKAINKEGDYSLTVTNAGGCKARDTIRISTGCGDLVFPTVFTPNGDGLNEQFGPIGGLSLASSYRLLIYNRFGNLVFQSASPYQKWKGDVSGIKLTGTYTYMATYMYDGERKMKKGTLVLFL